MINKKTIVYMIIIAIILIIVVGLILVLNNGYFNIDGKLRINNNQSASKSDLTDIEKYILGADGTGRDLNEICVDSTHFDSETNNWINEWTFINDETTEANEAEEVAFVTNTGYDHNGNPETGYYMERYFYIKYKEDLYRFKTFLNDGTFAKEVTAPISKNEKIKKIEVPKGKHIGEEVLFNGIEYIVLYGEGEKGQGAQLITKYALDNGQSLYNRIYLGNIDPILDDLPEGTIKALEKNKTSGTENEILDVEKAIYSYNNAVETLNETCEKLIKAGMSNEDINKIIDIRSVGSNPNNKNSIIREAGENELFSSTDLGKWPISDEYYEAGIAKGLLENGDINYLEDYDRLVAIGEFSSDNWYWLASRTVSANSHQYLFLVRVVPNNYLPCTSDYLLLERENTILGITRGYYVRPVITLSPNVLNTLIEN